MVYESGMGIFNALGKAAPRYARKFDSASAGLVRSRSLPTDGFNPFVVNEQPHLLTITTSSTRHRLLSHGFTYRALIIEPRSGHVLESDRR